MIETIELANKVIKMVIKMQGQMSNHCGVHLKLIYNIVNQLYFNSKKFKILKEKI